jgi:hypothetical protein
MHYGLPTHCTILNSSFQHLMTPLGFFVDDQPNQPTIVVVWQCPTATTLKRGPITRRKDRGIARQRQRRMREMQSATVLQFNRRPTSLMITTHQPLQRNQYTFAIKRARSASRTCSWPWLLSRSLRQTPSMHWWKLRTMSSVGI